MNHQNIREILDRTKFADLSADDLIAIEQHAATCQDCRRAFQAARISSFLLKNPTALQTFEPPPFFQAKVLSAWRERQAVQKPLVAIYRWWQASATLVLLMLMTVAGLITLTIFAPDSSTSETQAGMSEFNLYQTDAVLLNQKPSENLTRGQILEVLDESQSNSSK